MKAWVGETHTIYRLGGVHKAGSFSDQGSGYKGAHACDLPSLISQLVFSSGFNLKDSFVSKTSHEIVVTIC